MSSSRSGSVSGVASLSAPLGEALRVRARPADPLGGLAPAGRPGLLLFHRDGRPSDLDAGVPM